MLIQKQYNKIILQKKLVREGNAKTAMFFIIEESKETVLDF